MRCGSWNPTEQGEAEWRRRRGRGDIQDVKCDKLPFATCLNLYRDE